MSGMELIGSEEKQEVLDVLETGVFMRYGFDQERKGVFKVRQFEEEFKRYHGAAHALGVTSGSAALKVALSAMGVGPGDEVLVPAFTFIATYESVLEVGAIPVATDIDASLNMDPADIARKVTPYTKAVIPVHMCGAPADIGRIMEVCRGLYLMVLEDNAQAVGGSYKGKKLATFGEMGTFSLDYYKTLTTGEGGMILTDRKDLYDRADWYHDHGHDHNPKVSRAMEGRTILGFNYRMNEFQGALGLAQLRKLDFIIAEQKKNKAAVKEILSGVPGIGFRAIPDPDGDTATHLAFHFATEAQAEAFQAALGAGGVDTVCFKKNKWHYLANWEHLIAWSTANPKSFPFTNPIYRGKVDYSIRQYPQAHDLLGRTLFLGLPIRMPEGRLDQIRAAVKKAAEAL